MMLKFVLGTSVWLICCLPVRGEERDGKIVWKGSKAYQSTLASFSVPVKEASTWVLEEERKPHAFKLGGGGIFGNADFLVGRWYWFGTATKTALYLQGYYVNGDTGEIEFRESERALKYGARKLPNDPWRNISSVRKSKEKKAVAP